MATNLGTTDWSVKPFYKAFVQMKLPKADGKKEPIGEYTRTAANHCTLDEVQRLRHYMGILAPKAVLFDADSEPHSSNLLRLIQGESLPFMATNRNGGRGVHALGVDHDGIIKSASTHVMLACGIIVDIKTGRKNGLECLKFDGAEREAVYDADEYTRLPKYFTPIKSAVDFASLDEGDGRNQALFNYILTLQANDFTNDEAQECIKIINKYILKTPLSDDEIDTITRESAFAKPVFFKKNVFLHDKFAEYLQRTHNVKRVNGQLCLYRDGVYIGAHKCLAAEMIAVLPQLTKAKRNEVIQYLEDKIVDNVPEANVNLIAFRNGIFNIANDEFIAFSPDHVILNRIDWDYNPNAKSDKVDAALNAWCCGDMEIRAVLEEMAGYCFYRKSSYRKAFILTGNKRNGKSHFLTLLQNTLGSDNYSALDLKDVDDRFSTVMLFGKLANIGDDISNAYKSETSVFRKIVSGNEISAEQKGQPKFNFRPYAKLIFSANDTPHTKDPTGAVQDRLLIIPFDGYFEKGVDGFDPDIAATLNNQTAIEYFILLGIRGLKRILANNCFTRSAKIENELSEYDRENNPVKAFVEDFGLDEILHESIDRIYEEFVGFCVRNGYKGIYTKISFGKQLRTHYNVVSWATRVNGKGVRVYR